MRFGTMYTKNRGGIESIMSTFSEIILEWYAHHRRTLPWRGGSAYYVWLSEMMLQQTQVKTVIPFFYRFLERFPTLEDLSKSTLDEVYQVWQGLGYYHRARYLYQAAQHWVALGRIPKNYEEWLTFPGVGHYTASALTAILLEQPAAAIDGNIKRILQRYFGLDSIQEITKVSNSVLPRAHYGDYTQGLMDFGSMVCLPKSPRCKICPLSNTCALNLGTWSPLVIAKPKKLKRYGHIYICTQGDDVWSVQDDQRRLLKGLWGFPMSELSTENALCEYHALSLFGTVKHVFTHFALNLNVWNANTVKKEVMSRWPEGLWAPSVQREKLAFSRLMRKVEESILL